MMVIQRCSQRQVLLSGHSQEASPERTQIVHVLSPSSSHARTTMGLHWPEHEAW